MTPLTTSLPAVTSVGPVKVLTPAMVRVLAPSLTMPPVPLMPPASRPEPSKRVVPALESTMALEMTAELTSRTRGLEPTISKRPEVPSAPLLASCTSPESTTTLPEKFDDTPSRRRMPLPCLRKSPAPLSPPERSSFAPSAGERLTALTPVPEALTAAAMVCVPAADLMVEASPGLTTPFEAPSPMMRSVQLSTSARLPLCASATSRLHRPLSCHSPLSAESPAVFWLEL